MSQTEAPQREPDVSGQTGERDEFLAMLCADDELVRAEFDAIIAAEWPTTPPLRPGNGTHGAGFDRRAVRDGAHPVERRRPGATRRPALDRWCRERSPPPRG